MADEAPTLSETELADMERWARADLRGNLGQQANARRILRLVAVVRALRQKDATRPAAGDDDCRASVDRGHLVVADDQTLERAIAGALRAAIHAHGPITPAMIGSAVKRIVGQLRNARPEAL